MATTTIDAAELDGHMADVLRRVEAGEEILVEREGATVARITPVESPAGRRKVEFGWLEGRVELLDGWDQPLSEEELKDWYGDDE